MSRLTRFVAWIYVICALPATLVIALLIFFGGSLAAAGLGRPKGDGWITGVEGAGVMILASALAGLLLLQVLPWIFLLKRRIWAWWFLTVVFVLTTILSLMPFSAHPSKKEILEGLWWAFIPALTLVVLLLDPPGSWRSARKRRRRSRKRSK